MKVIYQLWRAFLSQRASMVVEWAMSFRTLLMGLMSSVRTLFYSIKKQRPILLKNWFAELSRDSPHYYKGFEVHNDTPPFYIHFVQAGPRVGYRWETSDGNLCEVNWLDPEPSKESSDYEQYIEELQEIGQRGFYLGLH
jgi:hypothetical protein